MKFSVMSPLTSMTSALAPLVLLLVPVTSQEVTPTNVTSQEVTPTDFTTVTQCHCQEESQCDVTTGQCGPGAECALGYWGPPACQGKCHCKHGVLCDTHNGSCLYGCAIGWSGEGCSTRVCPAGRFGPPRCLRVCHCATEDSCHAALGTCGTEGCAPGYWGPYCQEKSAENPVCDISDPKCKLQEMDSCYCKDPSCSLPPGECRSGPCPRGMTGNKCDQMPCPFTTYGPPLCNVTCHCRVRGDCDSVTGGCEGQPCQDQWAGHDCQQRACRPRYFRYPACDQVCFCQTEDDLEREETGGRKMDIGRQRNEKKDARLRSGRREKRLRRSRKKRMGIEPMDVVVNEEDEPMSPLGQSCSDSGVCPLGCKDGWQGAACNQRVCPPAKWGLGTCSRDCHCQQQEFCNSYSGECELGDCLPGWGGFYCQVKVHLARLEDEEEHAVFAPDQLRYYIGVGIVFLGTGVTSLVCIAICISVRSRRLNYDHYTPVNKEETHEMTEI